MKKVVIETQFLVQYNNPKGGVTVGGTQRYARQLGIVLKQKGFEIIFIAKANQEIEFNYEDLGKVITFKAKNGTLGNKKFSKKVYDYACANNVDLVIYSDLQIAFWYCYKKNLAIQHGIDWDGPKTGLKTIINNYIYLRTVKKLKKIICVDTNYINWSRIKDKNYFKQLDKYIYLPNFSDNNKFKYLYKKWDKSDEFILLYPRRMVEHRGFDIFINMCEDLFNKGYNIKPILAIEESARERCLKVIEKFNCEFTVVHPSFDEINEYYNSAFLSYVPTLWSEGTSLSAIESISCGCPVIVSDVGGLGNIVIPELNGFIIPASKESFTAITEKLLKNPEIRNKLSKNCNLLRNSFDVERWNTRIYEIIRELL